MSPLTVLVLVAALATIGVIMFVAVILGIHSESGYREMPTTGRHPLSAMVRRMLGVHVRRPVATDADDHREECLTGNSTDRWTRDGHDW